MSAAPQPSKAVANRPVDPDEPAVGILPPAIRAAIELRKLQNKVAAQVAALNWGKSLDLPTRRAVTDWCHRNDVDPMTEVEVLGGKVYRNAAWHLRKLSEMIAAELVEYAVADHVEPDERLADLAKTAEDAGVRKQAQKEIARRAMERVTHGIPEAAKGSVVFRVKLRSMVQEAVGVAWCGGGTKSKVLAGGRIAHSAEYDPIGEAEPIKTAESRAARRCVRVIAAHRPELAQELIRGEAEAEVLGERVAAVSHATRHEKTALTRRVVADPDAERPALPPGEIRREVMEVRPPLASHPMAGMTDPYHLAERPARPAPEAPAAEAEDPGPQELPPEAEAIAQAELPLPEPEAGDAREPDEPPAAGTVSDEAPTPEQQRLLERVLESSVWTDEERAGIRLRTDGVTRETMRDVLEEVVDEHYQRKAARVKERAGGAPNA